MFLEFLVFLHFCFLALLITVGVAKFSMYMNKKDKKRHLRLVEKDDD